MSIHPIEPDLMAGLRESLPEFVERVSSIERVRFEDLVITRVP